MPLDLRGFINEPQQWTGLYHAADQLEKRKLRADQLALQQQSKRAAAGSFLQNYLDPKDYLSGTTYDPMILQGLQAAKQQGAQLAAAGADAPTLMMALGPMVNKLTSYATGAKTINKQVDDQIKLMRESGFTGYDYSALKEQALKHAFFKTDANGKQSMVDPSDIDPSTNYIQKAIETNPELVTTAAGLDLFAKNSPMQKTLDDQVNYDKFGAMDKQKVHLIGQNWLVPERNAKGTITQLVPKHDIALEGNQPLIHNFTDELGNATKAPVRLLNEDIFDDMMQRRPDIADYLKGVVKQHMNEYTDNSGQKIDMGDPRAKLIARAIAYDELNRRKTPSIEHVAIDNKPSQAQINLNVQSTDKYLQNVENKAAAAKRGRNSELTPEEEIKQFKKNPAEAIGDIFTGKEDYTTNPKVPLGGAIITPNGKKAANNLQVYDITSSMPGGGLKAGRGVDYDFKRVFYNPKDRSLIVEQESGPEGHKSIQQIEVPESKVGQFIMNIAEANGLPKAAVKGQLEKLGYKGQRFTNIKSHEDNTGKEEFEKKQNAMSWRNALNAPQNKK